MQFEILTDVHSNHIGSSIGGVHKILAHQPEQYISGYHTLTYTFINSGDITVHCQTVFA